MGFSWSRIKKSARLIHGFQAGLTVAAGAYVCGCQRRKDVFGRFGSSPLKSTILALEGAFSTRMGVSILALHPAPLCNFESRLDIQ
ncbi:hypothetical protein C1890_16190 [Pseudomonas sp. DP16D-R1]|nr:hypothetical protein C1890_16190 [Pseudomonas sp. DP16D-R1]